jgi:ADP-ribose pyrophosphatase YjhB (NUDIX family)
MTSEPSDYTATLPRKRMGSGVLLTDAAGRVLLVEPTYKDHWEVPGGVVEADESPYDAAVRELKEELGLLVTPGRLLVVDWVPPRPGRTEGVMFIYSGGVLGADQERSIVLPADELRSWAWCTEAEADERLSDLLARRVRAAVNAAGQSTTSYLENGTPVA